MSEESDTLATRPTSRKWGERWAAAQRSAQRERATAEHQRSVDARRQLRVFVRQRVDAFLSLQCINEETRHRLIPSMIHHEMRVALSEMLQQSTANAVQLGALWCFGLGVFAVLLLTPYVISEWHKTWFGWFIFLGISISSLLIAMALFMVLWLPLYLGDQRHLPPRYRQRRRVRREEITITDKFWVIFMVVSYAYSAYAIHTHFADRQLSWELLVFQSGVVQLFVIFGWLMIIDCTVGVLAAMHERAIAADPHSIFVDRLLLALETVETASKSDKNWLNVKMRNYIMHRLEEAAQAASKIPTVIDAFDTFTTAWQRNHFRMIAAALRAKKQAVCVPRWDTREWLRQNLASALCDAALGNWDNLETCEPQPIRHAIILRARALAPDFLIAFLPLAALLAAKRFLDYPPDPQLQSYVVVTVLWAIPNLLSMLSAGFREKAEAGKAFLSLIPGASKT